MLTQHHHTAQPLGGLRAGFQKEAHCPAPALGFHPQTGGPLHALVLLHQQSPNEPPAWNPTSTLPTHLTFEISHAREQRPPPTARRGPSSPSLTLRVQASCSLRHCPQVSPTVSTTMASFRCPSASPKLILCHILSFLPSLPLPLLSSPPSFLPTPNPRRSSLQQGTRFRTGTIHCVNITLRTRPTEPLPPKS